MYKSSLWLDVVVVMHSIVDMLGIYSPVCTAGFAHSHDKTNLLRIRLGVISMLNSHMSCKRSSCMCRVNKDWRALSQSLNLPININDKGPPLHLSSRCRR
jgi:hypothetical protein